MNKLLLSFLLAIPAFQVHAHFTNLVVNGNFENNVHSISPSTTQYNLGNGNQGSGRYPTQGLWPEGSYDVVGNANSTHVLFSGTPISGDLPTITCAKDTTLNSCTPASVSTAPSVTGYATATDPSCAQAPTITYSDVSTSSAPSQSVTSAISSNFNGTSIAAGNYLWFHNHLDLTSYPSTDFQIFITGSTITGTVNNAPFTLAVPNSTISFSHAAATASYNFAGGQWLITIPWSEIGNDEIFSGGVAYPVPAGGISGGSNPVIWTQNYSTSSSSSAVAMKWQWSAAVYTNFTTNYNALGVALLHQSLHGGTPPSYSSYVTGGARGGGGSNFTGSRSSTGSVNINAASGCSYLMITRTWKATNCLGKSSTCDQIITVRDITPPVAVCKNKTITLVNGTASITPANINNGSYDNCGTVTLVGVSPSSFDCSDAGQNVPVTLTVQDACGNTSSCTATVTVTGAVPSCSIAVAPSNNTNTGGIPTNIYLGYGPQSATLTANSTGNSLTYLWTGPTSKLSSTTSRTPVFTSTTVGTYTFTVLITNSYGCTSTCDVTFCVKDVRVPGTSSVYVCNNATTHSATTSQAVILLSFGAILGMCNQDCGAVVNARLAPTRVASEEVKVYPNPNNGAFVVELPNFEGQGQITITDVQGKMISRTMVTDNDDHKINLNLGNVTRGVYFVDVVYGDQRFRTKLIVQ